MSNVIDAAAFDAWALRIGLSEKLRGPLKMVYCDRRTPTWAARECGLSASTVTRAVDKYPFGKCPCCGSNFHEESEAVSLIETLLRDGQFFITAIEANDSWTSDFEEWARKAKALISKKGHMDK